MTETDLVNTALGFIGHDEIESINLTNNGVAQTARRLYPVARDAALRAAHWNCATWRQRIGLLNPPVTTYPQNDWTFVYHLPHDPYCLKARRFESSNWDETTRFHPGQRPFRVEGRYILTNIETPVLIYTQRIIDINLFDANLFQATACLLASHFAISLRKDYKQSAELFKAYDILVTEAAGVDEAEGGKDTYISTDLLSDR
jgi:hypothetical protein